MWQSHTSLFRLFLSAHMLPIEQGRQALRPGPVGNVRIALAIGFGINGIFFWSAPRLTMFGVNIFMHVRCIFRM